MKNNWIYLVVILLIILTIYFKFFNLERIEGYSSNASMTAQDAKNAFLITINKILSTALITAQNKNDAKTQNYINKALDSIQQSLNGINPQDVIRLTPLIEIQINQGLKLMNKTQDDINTQIYNEISTRAEKGQEQDFSQMDMINNNIFPNIFNDNQLLYNSFTAYNTAYYNYVTCVEGTYNPQTATYDSSYDPNSKSFNSSTCNPSSLNSSYNTLLSNISHEQTNASNISTNLTSIDDLKNNQNTNIILRNELDLKLQDLYSIQQSLPDTNQISVDSTTYAFLLWTILATSMLFFVFTRSMSSSQTTV